MLLVLVVVKCQREFYCGHLIRPWCVMCLSQSPNDFIKGLILLVGRQCTHMFCVYLKEEVIIKFVGRRSYCACVFRYFLNMYFSAYP